MFGRLSLALLTGMLAGLASWAAWPVATGSAAPLPALQAALLGMGGCVLLHAAAQGWRLHRSGLHDNTPAHLAHSAGAAPRALAPFVHTANAFAARHPQRLIHAYRSFDLLVGTAFAAVWLTGLWFAAAEFGASPLRFALVAFAGAWLAWWTVSGLCVAVAVRSGTLPPFGVAPYVRAGRFPSHWVAKAYSRDG